MKQSKKLIIAANIGTILEWAEFTFYAYIAAIMSKLFFPIMDERTGILATFGIFALGYLMRPLGALLFGYIGDRFGRRTALQASIILMGLSSMLIGILPTYHSIGLWAPTLLLIFRCLQGLAVSGEFNGSSIFLMEHAKQHPSLAASWTGWSSAIGMMFGSFFAMIVTLPSTAATPAWRIPFLIGFLICICGLYLRQQFEETSEFMLLQADGLTTRTPISKIFQKHTKSFILATVLASAFGVYIYVGNIFYAGFLVHSANLPSHQAKLVVTTGTFFAALFFPFVARLADDQSGVQLIRQGFTLMILVGPALYLVTLTHSLTLILITQIFYAIADALVGAPLFRFINNLFPTGVRYTGASFSWSISMAIFAGTAPLLCAWLQAQTNFSYAPSLYISLAGIIGLFSLIYTTRISTQENNYATSKTLGP